jgi:hypothetical protein
MLPGLIVRVTGDVDAEVIAPAAVSLARGAATTLSLWTANLGKDAWGVKGKHEGRDPRAWTSGTSARMVGQWVALGGLDDPTQAAAAVAASVTPAALPVALKAGKPVLVGLPLFVPSVPGEYLLVLDILTPDHGSIVANGVEPTIIHVTVTEPVLPAASAPRRPTDPTTTDPATASDPATAQP